MLHYLDNEIVASLMNNIDKYNVNDMGCKVMCQQWFDAVHGRRKTEPERKSDTVTNLYISWRPLTALNIS